jgi:hypothetical protein
MALRPAAAKTRIKESEPAEPAREAAHQRKKPEERFWLQVDRQTKKSFTTLEAAEEMGVVIKNAHPIVRVSVYDAVDCVNKIIGEPEAAAAAKAE